MYSKRKIIGLSFIACLGLATALNAGKIATDPAAATPGFGGWNLDNVNVLMTDDEFNPAGYVQEFNTTDGSYPAMTYGDSFESEVKDDTGTVMGRLHGKNWPVGEPPGLKVIADSPGDPKNGKPDNCIITTSYLDSGYLDTDPTAPTNCNSPFQTHKRFKVNLQQSLVAGGPGAEESFDLVFNVAPEADPAMRRYQIFQKINNYTEERLSGYSVEVGFGVGANFTRATTADVNLTIGEGENEGGDIWSETERATFAHGLWGPVDSHFPEPGFFSAASAGFNVVLDGDNKGANSNGPLDGVTSGDYVTLFGQWLPSAWTPTGIFHDFDNDPLTDADIKAFWGDVDGDGTYAWTYGGPDFNLVEPATLEEWAMDPLYYTSHIEDVLNLGLNYIVNIGDVTTFDDFNATGDETATFTIRITPKEATVVTGEPGWVTNPPAPIGGSTGAVGISPDPFVVGTAVTVAVVDGDLNTEDNVTNTVDINVTSDMGETELVTLTETDVNTNVFRGTLNTNKSSETGTDNDGVMNVVVDTVLTATYNDADSDGEGTPATVYATATAEAPPPYVNNDSSEGIFSTMDNVSLFAMIFGFLAIGGIIARRQIAK